MIIDFGDKGTQDIFNGVASRDALGVLGDKRLWKIARRKLDILNRATSTNDLRVPPGNCFEELKGDLAGECSIRVNDKYRIVFKYESGNATKVRVLDYH